MTRRKLQNAFSRLDAIKKTREPEVPGVLGFTVNGVNTVEVGNRASFVWVRLRNNTNEVIQAFNDQVSPVYGLPVVVVRDEVDRVRYRIKSKDLGVYQNWGGAAYLPRHGNQHSFNPDAGGGGDVTFIYNRQFMPLAVHPSGTSGGGNVYVQPYAYYQGTTWKYAGGTGTASLLPYKPTGSNARMVLVYLDDDGNPQLLPGDTYFAASITGNAAVLPYVPALGGSTDIPLAAVRLVSGTSTLVWDNIYDLRPIIVSDGFIPTGTTGHEIQDDGTPLTNRPALNFVGSAFSVYDGGGVTNVSGTLVSSGIPERSIPIYEDGVFRITGTIIDFRNGVDVVVSGSSAYIYTTGSGGGGGAPTTAEYVVTADNGSLSTEVTIPGLAGHPDKKGAGVTGTISQEYDNSTTGLTWTPSTPSVVNSDTEVPSHLYVKSTDTTERFGFMDWTPGSGSYDARCKISLSIDTMASPNPVFGLIVANSANTYRAVLTFQGNYLSQDRQVYASRYTGTSYAVLGDPLEYGIGTCVYLKITRDTAYNTRWYMSTDGIGWQFISSYKLIFDVAKIGVVSKAGAHEAYVDWLRAQP